MDDIRTKIAVLESKLADHERRQREFMDDIETKVDDILEKLTKLMAESNQWAGARRLFTLLLTILAAGSAFIGWLFHQLTVTPTK